jgi:hypothetical protein
VNVADLAGSPAGFRFVVRGFAGARPVGSAARYNFGRRWSDMKTRTILAAVGLVLGIVAIPRSVAAKEATVTLAISGMT